MGIRYYAYAFDSDQTERALADPHSFLSADPLADAWGFEPGATYCEPTFEQALPERDFLYLDKAWSELQDLTGPPRYDALPRPAYRMFEGAVAMCDPMGWEPWVRTLPPEHVRVIAEDLNSIDADELRSRFSARRTRLRDDDASYAFYYFDRARAFAAQLAADRRGMVYMIG